MSAPTVKTSSAQTLPAVPPDPEPIMRLATGFMAAKHLFAANELGIFEALGEASETIDALDTRTGLTPRAASISADAMVALGILERDGSHYGNGGAAAAFLSGTGPGDLRPFLRFWDKVSYSCGTGRGASAPARLLDRSAPHPAGGRRADGGGVRRPPA